MATRKRRSRGNIEERGDGFRVRVYAGVDPLTGKQHYLKETHGSYREAEKALTRLQNQVDEKRHPRSNVTVSQVLEQWLEVARHEDSTRERYQDLIRLYIEPTFGTTAAAKIDAELLERFYARLRDCKDLCGGKRAKDHECTPLAANTVRKIHFIFRSAFDRAVRWRYLSVNQAEIAQPPSFERSEPDPPSAAEAASLLREASEDPQWCLLLWLTMVTGCRRGELCALRWGDVDLAAGMLSIERSYSKTRERAREKSTKTRQRRRIALDTTPSSSCRSIESRRGRTAPPSARVSTTTRSSSAPNPTGRPRCCPAASASATGAWPNASNCAAPGCTHYGTTPRPNCWPTAPTCAPWQVASATSTAA
nr:site-specific integrase [Actinopolyspora mortivallis]